MLKVAPKPNPLSIKGSMLEDSLVLFEVQTWTQASPNAKTAGSGAIQQAYAGSKELNVSNVMAYTKPFTIENLHSAVRLMKKLTLLDSKQKRVNLAFTLSSTPIAKAIIKPIPPIVLSESTISTRNSIVKNIPRSEKITKSQFVLLGTPPRYDL